MPDSDIGATRLSVIVPVHNGGTHLRECLDSILAQTLDDFEVIVVNDASADDTASILREYVQLHGHVRVLTQTENQGVSAARNRGIDAARGTFVAFVDADDVIRPRMYEHLLKVAEDGLVDMVSCGIQLMDDEGNLSSPSAYPMKPGVLHDNGDVRALLETAFTSKLLWFPCRSLYRRSILEVGDIRFDKRIRKGEDSLFNLQMLVRAQRCSAVQDAYYLYRKHAGSVTARPLRSESSNLETLGDEVTKVLSSGGFPSAASDDFYRYVLSSDLPTALVRLAGTRGTREQLSRLRQSHHVRIALGRLGLRSPKLAVRVRILLLLFKYLPTAVVSAVLTAMRRVGSRPTAATAN